MSRRPGALFVAVSAGRAPLTGTARDACDATRVLWMHRGGSRCNEDACHATASDATSLHLVRAADDAPGHRSRGGGLARRVRHRAVRCAAGSACSRDLRNVASDATPRLSTQVRVVCRIECGDRLTARAWGEPGGAAEAAEQ